MFFLYDMFKDGNALTPTASNISVDTIKISNGIFDHMNILNLLNIASNVFDTDKPSGWTSSTLLNATFNDTLNGGSIGEFVGFIDHLEIQRKEYDSDDWITLQKIYKNQDTEEIEVPFTFIDTYTKNNTRYKYQVLPIDLNGNAGTALQSEILSYFNDAYIADASHIYKITHEYSIDNKQTNNVSAIYTPYGSQYPFIAFNAETKYDNATITAVLISPTSNSRTSSYLDRKAQIELVEEFNNWLTNGRPKILKDFNGLFKIVVVTNPIPNSYYKELGNGLASTTFNVVEVGSFTQEYLDKLGMINQFPLNNPNN